MNANEQRAAQEAYNRRREEAEVKAAAEKARNEEALRQARRQSRVNVAERIAMVLVDKVNHDIIRPGPTPEERECYAMSQELRDITPELVQLITGVFDQTDGVK